MLGQGDSESPALPMAEAEAALVMTDLTSRSTDDCWDPEDAAKEARPNPPRLPDPRDEESHMALSYRSRDKLCKGKEAKIIILKYYSLQEGWPVG